MDFNTYAIEKIAAGVWPICARPARGPALVESARIGPRGVGPAVGSALIRLGHWLAPDAVVAAPNAGVRVAR